MATGYLTLTENYSVSVGATVTVSVDCRGVLDSGVIVSSVSIADADGLTISGEAVNSAVLVIKRRNVPISHAIQYQITDGLATAGATYEPVVSITLSNSDVIPFAVPITVAS